MGSAGDRLAALQVAPRLHSSGVGYAAWRDSMDVLLQRTGAEGIHRKEMAEQTWRDLVRRVEVWADDELAAALLVTALDGGSGAATSSSSSSSSGGAQTPSLPAPTKEARKLVTVTVERSRRVHGTLYSALPDELRAQVAHLPSGWAYGLWHWLETKFQSTEQDSVADLLEQWTTLRQQEDESFDAYRARVNRLRALLEYAKEKPSANQYSYFLLRRLLPRYQQAVLALSVGGQLKDAEKIDWEMVTALLNAHERNELRLGDASGGSESAASARAMAATGSGAPRASWAKTTAQSSAAAAPRGGAPSAQGATRATKKDRGGPRTLSDVQCFNCAGFGHLSRNCPKPKKSDASAPATERGEQNRQGDAKPARDARPARAAPSAAQQKSFAVNSNRYDSLSDESDEEAQMEDESECKHGVAHAATERPVAEADWSWGIDTMASLHIGGNKAAFVGGLKRCKPV
jgi:hypothetical protein